MKGKDGPKARQPITDPKLEERFFQALYKINRNIYILALIIRFTGFRIGDVLTLTKADVMGNFLIIEENKTKYIKELNKKKAKAKGTKPKPGKEPRKIEIHDDLRAELDEHIKYLSMHDLLAESPRKSRMGNPISYRQATRILLQAAKAVGIPIEEFGWHSLRKMCFTAVWNEYGEDIRVVQHFSGHTDPNTSSKYIKITDKVNSKIAKGMKSPINTFRKCKSDF